MNHTEVLIKPRDRILKASISMSSPRYNSSGRYSTRTSTSTRSSVRYPVRPYQQIDEEGGELIAEAVMRSFLHALPVPNWIGKKMVDYLREEGLLDDQTSSYLDVLWTTMIALDNCHTSLLFTTILITDPTDYRLIILSEIQAQLREVEEIACKSIVALHQLNPATLRSGKVRSKVMIKFALVHSITTPELSKSWDLFIERSQRVIREYESIQV